MLLAESVTDHVTVVVPKGKLTGELFVIEATVQLSPVTETPKTTPEAVHKFKSVLTVISAGAVFEGAIVSETVINCVAETVFPAESLTCQTTDVIPGVNKAGALFDGTPTPQLSVADATPILTLQLVEIMFAGIVKTGSSLSLTVIV